MLETIRQFYDQAAEAANEYADLAEQATNDAVNSAAELATQAYDAVAAEAESLLTQAEQVIPSLSADLASTFVSTADSLDKTGHAFVTSVKSTASSLWKADLTSTLTDTLASLSSTIKPYVPEFLQPYLAEDSSESQVAATEENTEAWYSPIVSLARSVQAYVMGDEPESAPAVASVLQSAESVYVDEAPVVTEKVAAEPKSKAKTSPVKTSQVQIPVDFSQSVSAFVSPVSSFSDDALLSLSSSVVDTYTSAADFVSVPVSYASMVSTPETTLVAEASLEAVSVIPESTLTEGSAAVVPQVVAAQDSSALLESTTSGAAVAVESSTRYLGYGETSYATLDSAFFGAQWINSVSPATASVISSAGAAVLGNSQNPIAQTENANLVFGANPSFGSSASVAEQTVILAQGKVGSADVKFAVGASALPESEMTLFSSYASVAQAAAASLKNSSEILHVQQASRSGVSSVLPSPFPMVFVNGLVTTIGKNKEQAQAVAEMTLPLTTVQSQGQMSGGADSDQRGRQSEAEALAFDELASVINAASVQTSVAAAGEVWDAPFIPQTRDVFVGA